MLEQASAFSLSGKPIFYTRYGSGHINTTYLLLDDAGRLYILQKINQHVFKDPEPLMQNIAAVTTHLRGKVASDREVLTLVPTLTGKLWLVDGDGEYWRLYSFVSDSICMDTAANEKDFYESAVAFGMFQRRLSDFPADNLVETIPNFHNTPVRYDAFMSAVSADVCGRVKTAQKEIDYAMSLKPYASTLTDMQAAGRLPLRVTHNDTKLNNVLFDRFSRKAICVVDLDTVMPGLLVNDFGDSIRFGASTAKEDETDLDRVSFSLSLFEAYVGGFLSACGGSITKEERASLCDGAKMMTLECGVRFLADYLAGDTYFHIGRPSHNLDRCRTQFKLVADMDKCWDAMQRIVHEFDVSEELK